jgi:hypothetical protein
MALNSAIRIRAWWQTGGSAAPRWRILAAAIAALCAALGLLALLLSLVAIPIPVVDAPYFLSAAHFFANGEGLRNPFYHFVPDDPGARVIWHGWLYPWLIGTLPASSDYATILVGPALIGLGAAVLYAHILRRIARARMIALSLPPLLGFALYFIAWGRPELLVMLLLVAVPPLLTRFTRMEGQALLALLLGVIAVTHPTIAMMCVPLIVLAHGIAGSTPRFFLRAMLCFVVITPLTLALLTTALPGFTVADWMHGLLYNAHYTSTRDDPGSLAQYYLENRVFPGIGMILPIMVLFGIHILRGAPRAPFALALTGAGTLAWIAIAWYFGFRLPATCYNLLAFGPLTLIGAAWMMDGPRPARGLLRQAMLAGQTLLALIALGGVLYSSAVNLASYQQGVPMRALQAALVQFTPGDFTVAVPDAFASPVAEMIGERRVLAYPGPMLGAKEVMARADAAPVKILMQAVTGYLGSPPVPPGYRLADDRFHRDPALFFGLPIKKNYNDWAFAILCKGEEVCRRLGAR